jgi:hypothetical protein
MNKKLDALIDEDIDDLPKKEKKTKTLKIKVKPLSKKQLNDTITCSICSQEHKLIDCITTCCEHCFGKECFLTRDCMICPLCSNEKPSYIEYRQRTYKKNKVLTPFIVGVENLEYLIG